MNALSLENVSFRYDDRRILLDNVSLEIEEGIVAAISGDSGCGKSTLAMIACGVIPKAVKGIFSGTVRVLGEDIKGKEIFETADKISMVFQDPESQLFASEVLDEIAFAPENLCYDPEKIDNRVQSAIEMVNMQGFSSFSPSMLSGGQQQLIALASVLSLDPQVIILDEVAAQIDEQGVEMMKAVVKKLKQRGKTVVIIEHGDAFADLYDTVFVMENGKVTKA